MNPYYRDDAVTLYHGRCEDVLPTLPAGGVDLVFTSPPYNLGNTSGGGFPGKEAPQGHYSPTAGLAKRGGQGKWSAASRSGGLAHGYDEHDDAMPHEAYVAWQHDVLRACWRVLTDRGAIFYNHKPRVFSGRLVPPTDYVPDDLRPFIRQEIIWARAGGINFSPAFYVPTHERIVVVARLAWRLKSKGASGVGDVWTVPQESNNPHPAPFPISLPARAIETAAPALVLDPFSGSGTTLRAAKDAGVKVIGIEQSERWCEYTARRLDQTVLDLGGAA